MRTACSRASTPLIKPIATPIFETLPAELWLTHIIPEMVRQNTVDQFMHVNRFAYTTTLAWAQHALTAGTFHLLQDNVVLGGGGQYRHPESDRPTIDKAIYLIDRVSPHHPREYAVSAAKRGRYHEALNLCDEAMKLAPRHVNLLFLGLDLATSTHQAERKTPYRNAIAALPARDLEDHRMGQLFELGERGLAFDVATKVVDRPRARAATIDMAQCVFDAGRAAHAPMALYQLKTLCEYEMSAIAVWDLFDDPAFFDLCDDLVSRLESLGLYEAATFWAQKAIRRLRTVQHLFWDHDLPRRRLWQTLFEKAGAVEEYTSMLLFGPAPAGLPSVELQAKIHSLIKRHKPMEVGVSIQCVKAVTHYAWVADYAPQDWRQMARCTKPRAVLEEVGLTEVFRGIYLGFAQRGCTRWAARLLDEAMPYLVHQACYAKLEQLRLDQKQAPTDEQEAVCKEIYLILREAVEDSAESFID